MSGIGFDNFSVQTADIEDCDNSGCAFNFYGKCTCDFGHCFGYIETVELINNSNKGE